MIGWLSAEERNRDWGAREMALDSTAANGSLTGGSFAALLRNLIAGAVCAVVSLAFSLSYAALIFSGPLTPYLAYGIAATFVDRKSVV